MSKCTDEHINCNFCMIVYTHMKSVDDAQCKPHHPGAVRLLSICSRWLQWRGWLACICSAAVCLLLILHTRCVCLPFSCLSRRSKVLSLAIFIRVASKKSTLLFCLCCRYTTFKTRWKDSTNMLVFTVVRALKHDAHCVTRVQYSALKYRWNLSSLVAMKVRNCCSNTRKSDSWFSVSKSLRKWYIST